MPRWLVFELATGRFLAQLTTVRLLIIDDRGMRKLRHTAAEDLLEIIMRRYQRVPMLLTSNRPIEGWGKLPGDTSAIIALLGRLLHHAYALACGPRSGRTRFQGDRSASSALCSRRATAARDSGVTLPPPPIPGHVPKPGRRPPDIGARALALSG
jgi:hypothetical protein